MKTFVIGDIHGRLAALKEVLKKASFDQEIDKLIILGDIVDGGSKSKACVEELLKIKNKIYIYGNHDIWWMNSYKNDDMFYGWLEQGGAATVKSYKSGIPQSHKDFFETGVYYYIEDDKLFVHGGFDVWNNKTVQATPPNILIWDRDIINFVKSGKTIPGFKEVFIGHTTTQMYGGVMEPIKYNNLYLLDCGAGWNGKLCIMNVDTKESWLSKQQIRPN